MASSGGSPGNDSRGIFIIFVSLPMFAVLTGAYWALAAAGRLDWLGWPRSNQYAFVVAACLSLSVIMALSGAVHGGNLSDLPWTMRVIASWAAIVVPLALIAIGFRWLNSPEEQTPAKAFVAIGTSGIAALAIGLFLGLVSAASATSQREQKQIETAQRTTATENTKDLEEAKTADPEKDFPKLLSLANHFHEPGTRKIALDKLRSTGPKLSTQLAEALSSDEHYFVAMRFLEDTPDVAVDPPVASAISDAIKLSTGRIRSGSIHYLDIDGEGELVLAVVSARQVASTGFDYAPAVRDFVSALDSVEVYAGGPEKKKPNFTCRSSLNRWLKDHH